MTYLLLRNNKETGPYSLNDLVKMGLKAYDLVWVEGRSAAWRYPSEINELKAYAPVVEEQPFDRFFKKTVESENTAPVAEEPLPAAEPLKQTETTVGEVEPLEPVEVVKEAFQKPRKSVFVTLPSQKKNAVPVPEKKESPVYPEYQAYLPKSETPQQPVHDEETVAEIKYSQPLDEIKEMYVKTLQDRKTRNARRGLMKVGLQRAAVILALLGVGVLAGFIIKPKSPNLANPAAVTAHVPQTATQPVDTVETEPVASVTLPESPDKSKMVETPPEEPPTVLENLNSQPPKKNTPPSDQQQQQPVTGKKPSAEPTDPGGETYGYTGVENDSNTGERRKAVRSNNYPAQSQSGKENPVGIVSPKAPSARSILHDQVVVTSNDYKRVAFGGIRDLRLTVTNNSKYELDNVIVEIDYLKPSEQPLKTEKIQFRGIPANESSTIRVPDTNRGIKVAYRIVSIGSRELLVGSR